MRSKTTRILRTGALVAGGALLLSACGGGGSEEGGSGGDGSLTFVTFGSAFQEAQEVAFVDPFSEETGADITVDSPTDLSKLKVMVETGDPEWDVYLAGSAESFAYCGTLFEELDFSGIERDDFAEGTISDCGIPVDTYSYVVAYNTETYGDTPPTSLEDFFDLEKYPGTRAMSGDPAEGNLELALMADGVDSSELYPIDYDRAFAKLDEIKAETVFWSSGAEQVEMMESKRADMVLAWSGRGFEAVENGAPYAPMWDRNAYHWASLAIVKGSANTDLAQQFIDFSVSPEPQAAFAESIAYGAANLRATPELNPEAAEWDSGAEDHRDQSWSIDPEWWGENAEEVLSRWTSWTAG
ncbi:ABC transporter substrate-binding protein [Leucobacter sp. CSA1]|uniref:ABC transporter substrate-binding protein n=1 Tax=Leucobacter chromiisoli TaxID=2796471 RepID=A0A934Q934_9MICO|nr:ABC transporter substrate-binding protein [Leucobacter chromiisoli]MBK0420131.1 ABC transporter substrate-binding protein [Leucobacter chromiisoli]